MVASAIRSPRARWMAAGIGALVLGVAGWGTLAVGQNPSPLPAPDPVARLTAELKAGGPPLKVGDAEHGVLVDLLKRLDVHEDSQVLVFSKTSLQSRFTERHSPRAIFFNDAVSVGFVPGAPLIEIAVVGDDGLTRFYSVPVDATKGAAPMAERGCATCHITLVSPAPIMFVGSVTPLANGGIANADNSSITDARSSFESRWGGWYVTGLHGDMKHRGNVVATDPTKPHLDPQAGQNLTDLSSLIDTSRYLRSTSDIVALMTLEHQVGFAGLTNKIIQQQMVGAYPDEIDETIRELVDYMVGVDDASWSASIKGVSNFTATFPKRGPRDAQGRSLRDFDLDKRLFRYPLSYMIYSPSFEALDPEIKTLIYRRLAQVLSGGDPAPKYARFAEGGGREAMEILAATKPGLPEFWPRAGASPA